MRSNPAARDNCFEDRDATLIHRIVLIALVLTACATPGKPSTVPGKAVICIDPGHPSEINDGYQKQNGTTETHICWQVAQRLRAILVNQGFRVVLTKQRENQLVRNVRRAEVANRSHARLMLRLHCDTGAGTGYRIFYPDRAARDGKIVGPSPIVQQASSRAASAIHDSLTDGLAGVLKDNGMASDRSTLVGRKKGGALIGSIHSRVPVVLVEMVFLNNPADAAFIKSAAGQDKFARALATGIESISR